MQDSDSSVVELVRQLLQEITLLFRQELSLVRAETLRSLTNAGTGLSWIALGILMLIFGLMALLLSAVLALALVMPGWLAALSVGAVVSVLGALLFGAGRRHLDPHGLSLPRTRASLRRHKIGGIDD